MTTIRVAIVTNALGPPTRGNGTTVHRWLGWLPDVDVRPIPLAPGFDLPPGRKPDLVHGYHAIHGGVHALALARRHDLPLVISLGGTDLYALKQARAEAGTIRDVLEHARVVTGAFPSFGIDLDRLLEREIPYAAVPRGVAVSDAPTPKPGAEGLRILLPAGIRPVKDPLLALTFLERLAAAHIPARLCIAGPTLNPAYAREVDAALAECPHAERLILPRSEMALRYAHSDVVWSTSRHEGGPNALLEALAAGCPVYARDVPGNHDLLAGPEAPGTLFAPGAPDLEDMHRAVIAETPAARDARVQHARDWLRTHHDSATEARALRGAYERALATAR